MWYNMINKRRNEWLSSRDCPVSELIAYMESKGAMRDAQIDALKTYLYLKISCENKPLYDLFASGTFNSIDISSLEVTESTRACLKNNPAALALYEYASLKNDAGEQVSETTVKAIKTSPNDIDYNAVFKDIFYNVSYTDYLFSLPMGAGKTYLMAAFIYLDLYFAQNEPDNNAFAHNFIIFAPSGLKSSVVPSLKTIQRFDPSWIIPEPAAGNIKRLLKFEVLDQNKTANKSNKTKNPNVQKINLYQPAHELMGLVAVTNAEKVILDRIKEQNGQINLFDKSDDEKDRQANELRNLIGKLPNLSIFIDEVHHAVSDEIKLRAVVNRWAENGTINSVIGFSGTPYLESAEKLTIKNGLQLSSIEIANIVYYYPLVNGIGNFLKRPTVYISNNTSSLEIVEAGVKTFFDEYKDRVYSNGLVAKLGIYCGSIEKLEEQIYPLVEKIASEFGLNPNESILRFHKGNKTHPMPTDSQLQFDSLDKDISKVRIVLLVQIGKEGWDCTSLTGIILSQEGDCPTNMVLQTSCRCLRQVDKGQPEGAMIYLNENNGNKLNEQLRKQHHISIKEFENGNGYSAVILNRYDRTKYLKLPKIQFYQLRIKYKTLLLEEELDTDNDIAGSVDNKAEKQATIIKTQTDFTGESGVSDKIDIVFEEKGDAPANFNVWIGEIAKGSFGFVTIPMLEEHTESLRAVFDKITYLMGGKRYFSSKYFLPAINANIRKAFYEKRSFESVEELIPQDAGLLKVESLKNTVAVHNSKSLQDYYPKSEIVEKIIMDDKGKLKIDSKTEKAIALLEELGEAEKANDLRQKAISHPMKDHSFHYLPYKTDSEFERTFLEEILKLPVIEEKNLEVYYNGDRAMTEFKIRCYKGGDKKWRYIGMYTPDFLIIRRKNGKIHKAIIAETKGKVYANDSAFKDKKTFMETEFIKANNDRFGYNRFDYLYLEDSLPEPDRIRTTATAISAFFEEVK